MWGRLGKFHRLLDRLIASPAAMSSGRCGIEFPRGRGSGPQYPSYPGIRGKLEGDYHRLTVAPRDLGL